jgi:hypothetical protein
MSKHTEGLLIADSEFIETADAKGLVARTGCSDYGLDAEKENARRLAACWNRLEMFCTEDIEDKDCDLFGNAELERKLAAMTAQRDSLLWEIKKIRLILDGIAKDVL